MNAIERPISDHVVVQCPACGACESIEAAALAARPAMVCRECGETWPSGGLRPGILLRRSAPSGPVLEAERLPLVSYADASDTAWKAKIAGDYWPEPPRPRRLPMTLAAVVAVFFLVAFFGARQAAVAALPDLAGLYAAIGLPVNLDGLAIEDVSAERSRSFDGSRVTVHATIRNLGGSDRQLPSLVAEVNGGETPLGFDPPATTIGARQSMALVVDLNAAPENADALELRFPRRGETIAIVGAARLAQP